MREIKFRYVYKSDYKDEIFIEYFTMEDIEQSEKSPVYYFCTSYPYYLISRDQYTGLKDTNGVEIYEGDLCTLVNPYNGNESYNCGKIVFSYEYVGGWVLTSDGKEKLNIGTRTEQIKVIGNIHENLEL
jgi:uncharacterized phage protein (TIGR01671 family)